MDRELAKARSDHMQKLDAEKAGSSAWVATATGRLSPSRSARGHRRPQRQILNYCASLDVETGQVQENKQALDDYLLSPRRKSDWRPTARNTSGLIREDEKTRCGDPRPRSRPKRSPSDCKTKGSRQQREALAHAYGYSTNPQAS